MTALRFKTCNSTNKSKGFNLIELMIVIAIVGIIAAIAYPAYTQQVQKTRRAEGKSELLEMLQAQERFYSINNTYATDLTSAGLGYPAANNILTERGYYQLSAVACGAIALTQCINITAVPTPGGVQVGDNCGTLTIDSRGNKTENGVPAPPVSLCW